MALIRYKFFKDFPWKQSIRIQVEMKKKGFDIHVFTYKYFIRFVPYYSMYKIHNLFINIWIDSSLVSFVVGDN